jgi:putative transcriptional regulator
MTIRHHLSDTLLMGYSSGVLPEAFSLIVATHLSMCDECRARLGAFDTIGGAVLDTCEDVAMSADSLTMAMARLAEPARAEIVRRPKGAFPEPLNSYIGGDLASVKWRSLGMGVKQAVVPTGQRATARLLFIPAGQKVPDHGHNGTELTLVLQGAFRDDTDRFGVGDVEIADEALNHQPVAEAGMDCICLAATDAPLRFNGLLPRIAQRFLRI